jgi:3-oxoacyl-[acyl-carrier-protein] synthase-3
MKHVGILGVGKYLPERRLTNFDLERMVETTDEWITTRTGIKERRIADKHEKTSDLAVKAARDALHKAHVEPSKLELIIVATISPNSNFPSVACLVQKALGARHAVAFDISAACTGYLYALSTARQFIQNGTYKNALIIAAEKITSLIDWKDRSTCVLFGDGAGACVLGPVKGDGIIADYLESHGEYGELMQVIVNDTRHPLDKEVKPAHLPYVVMQGKELFKVAVNSMAKAAEVAVERAKIRLSDVACVVPHQANDRIITAAANKLDIPKEKIYINIDRYGNMSAASIAVALAEALEEKRIRKGDYVILVAFGAGLTSGACVVRW